MFVGAKAVPFSAESAIMVEANAALERCLFAMELGLVFASNQTQKNSWTASMATSEGDDGVWKPSCRSFGSCRTIEVEPGSLDIQNPHLTCACSQQRWSPLPANKCLMLCAGLDGTDSSELEVVLLSLT
ncbi:hypothetical protein Pyn_33992 [Prunus yedoensis var. nudiflora]|uniref:Uncharacterized protein n=1 Tax=Prunus yedoensis var. nudiflora TaxID=2094558 RepID=A0A314XTG2_PRUYE|nr:hypothetical protein Pyn_33992 [Prunus yedoensis var. nudiflora]